MEENEKKAFLPKEKPENKFKTDMKQIGDSLFSRIILPSLKSLLVDTVTKGFHMLIYGDMPPQKNGYTNYTTFGGQISTASGMVIGGGTNYSSRAQQNQTSTPGWSYEKIMFITKEAAESTIEYVNSLIDNNGYAKISDVFDSAGLGCIPSASEWGWRQPINPKIHWTCENGEMGYQLRGFPPVVKIA